MSANNLYKKQLRKLYAFNALGNLSIAGAAWVLLLVTQGYSLIQVGIAETVFHLVSITCEVPSGVFADVFGRKRAFFYPAWQWSCRRSQEPTGTHLQECW